MKRFSIERAVARLERVARGHNETSRVVPRAIAVPESGLDAEMQVADDGTHFDRRRVRCNRPANVVEVCGLVRKLSDERFEASRGRLWSSRHGA